MENGDRVPPTSAMMLPLGFQGALPNKEQLKSTTSVFLQLSTVIVLAVPNLKTVFILSAMEMNIVTLWCTAESPNFYFLICCCITNFTVPLSVSNLRYIPSFPCWGLEHEVVHIHSSLLDLSQVPLNILQLQTFEDA